MTAQSTIARSLLAAIAALMVSSVAIAAAVGPAAQVGAPQVRVSNA